RFGIAMDLDEFVLQAHRDKPQPEPSAQFAIIRERLQKRPPGTARHGDIDRIGDRLPLHRLMEQRQREPRLEFYDDRLFPVAHGDHVGSSHLALHGITLPFEQALDRQIKVALPDAASGHAAFYPPTARNSAREMMCRWIS